MARYNFIPTLDDEFGYSVVTAYNMATGLALIIDTRVNKLPTGALSELYAIKNMADACGVDRSCHFAGNARYLAMNYLADRIKAISA